HQALEGCAPPPPTADSPMWHYSGKGILPSLQRRFSLIGLFPIDDIDAIVKDLERDRLFTVRHHHVHKSCDQLVVEPGIRQQWSFLRLLFSHRFFLRLITF